MVKIVLKTIINSPMERCFNLSRSIDLHVDSMKLSNEKVIAGRRSGLIELYETVSWKATHFGLSFTMKNQITQLIQPYSFTDEMITGPFKSLKHRHEFSFADHQTIMTDIFEFAAPFGVLGRISEKLLLSCYMRKLLIKRNELIKTEAEKNPASGGALNYLTSS